VEQETKVGLSLIWVKPMKHTFFGMYLHPVARCWGL